MSRDLKRESKSRLRHLQKGHLGQGPEHVCCVGDIVRKTVVGGGQAVRERDGGGRGH